MGSCKLCTWQSNWSLFLDITECILDRKAPADQCELHLSSGNAFIYLRPVRWLPSIDQMTKLICFINREIDRLLESINLLQLSVCALYHCHSKGSSFLPTICSNSSASRLLSDLETLCLQSIHPSIY